MDVDEAWERFQKSEEPYTSFRRSSIDGKLDTIAAQIQEMSTDLNRVADIVPQVMGDRGALEADEQDPIDMVLGDDSPDLSSLTQQMGGGMPPEGAPGGAPEEAPAEGGPVEETEEVSEEEEVEKASDDDGMDDVRESAEELDEEVSEMPDTDPGDDPEDAATGMPEPPAEGMAVSVTDDTPEGDVSVTEVSEESAEPVEDMGMREGQEGIPVEGGAPDLLDEINENQPEGLLNVYDRFIEGMKAAAHQMVDSGRLGEVSNLAGAQNAIDNIWRTQVLPLTEPIMKSGDGMKEINTGKQEDGIQSAHEVPLPAPGTEGEANTTATDNDATQAPASEGRTTAQAPHALDNDTTTVGSENPPSFRKAVPAEPVADGQGMEPVEKSLDELEGVPDDYADPVKDDDYTDPIRKSVPSFREVMAEPKEERFLKVAEMRHGPHKSLDQFLKSWYGDEVADPGEGEIGDNGNFGKSMTAAPAEPDEDSFQGSVEKSCDGEGFDKAWNDDRAMTETEAVNDAIELVNRDNLMDLDSGHKEALAGQHSHSPDDYINTAITNAESEYNEGNMSEMVSPEGVVIGYTGQKPGKVPPKGKLPSVRGEWIGDKSDADPFSKTEGAMTAGSEGAVNPVYGESVEKSTAGQAGPSMSMEKSCDQLSDVDGAFGKSADTGATPVGDELQGPECDGSADTGAKDVGEAMRKSMENGKPLPSFQEMMSFRKSMPYAPARPSAIASVNGDITRPEESSFRKAAPQKPVVRMGFRQDPRKVVERDLEEYRIYKTQRGY